MSRHAIMGRTLAAMLLAAAALAAVPLPTVAKASPGGAPATLLDRLVVPRQPGPMAPRDECAAVPGARAFRLALARAVAAKDTAALARLADPKVQMGYGGDDGTPALRRAGRQPAFWTDLAGAVELGCAAGSDGSLTMPWIFTQDPGGIDSFDAMLVRGTRVAMRAAPSAGARVVRSLDWQFVELAGPGSESDPFLKIRTSDKAEGYVARSMLRSLVATRVIAERKRSVWRITAIVAGD